MFGSDDSDEDRELSDVVESVRAAATRSTDDECDFCGSSEGSVIVSRGEQHPDVSSSPPVVRCHDCYNDPETYHDS